VRIVFASLGAHGHLYPTVPFALAARELGHDVVFAVAQPYRAALEEAGLRTVPAGVTLDEAVRTAGFAGAFGRVLPTRMVNDLKPVLPAAGGADLVVHGAANVGAAIAGRLAGLPTASVAFGRVADGELAAAMFPLGQAIAAEFGVPVSDPRTMDGTYVDICPPSLQIPGFTETVTAVSARYTPWNPADDLPAALLDRQGDRPLVYVTLGTVFGRVDVFRLVLGGLASLPVDVLVATGPQITPDHLGEVPANVSLCEWVPQTAVLEHADLVVHHGGSGTTLGAAARGVPQVILPLGADQHANAAQIVAAGCGLQLDPATADGPAVADHVRNLLSSSEIGESVGRLAAEIAAQPSPAEAVADLVDLVSR
jgi:UDP:flavonoid glycosyltransferase YjiC (YdhE family)